MDLTPDDVAEILQAIDGSDVDALELETARFKLTLRRTGGGWTQATEVLTEPDVVDLPGTEAAAAAPTAGPAAGVARDGLHDVVAPLPGTFYRASEPGAPPLVEVGDQVGEDTVIGLLETMKLFNSIGAGVSGTVAEICVANGESAEQGAVLARISR
jgi:acetyl-CoA carboxylase biotin carboxyl carrier protein